MNEDFEYNLRLLFEAIISQMKLVTIHCSL